jgi:Ca2+-binding EF-hand superfamily protein
MRWLLAALLLPAVLLPTGWAAAQSPGQDLFQALDLNGDGYVSLSEAAGEAVVVQRFDRADKDRDGKLSPREFANLKKVKVRVAKSKRERDEERSAATGSSNSVRKDKTARAGGG